MSRLFLCCAIGVASFWTVRPAVAQVNLGDSDDQSALLLNQGVTAVSANVGDDSMKISVSSLEDRDRFWTFEAKGRAVNGFSSVFEGDEFSSEFTASIGHIWKGLLAADSAADVGFIADDWLQIGAGYRRGTYTLFQEDAENPTEDVGEDLPEASVVYNLLHSSGKALLGIGGGYRKETNFSSLRKIEGVQRTVVTESGDSSIIVDEDVTAREGDLETFDQWYGNVDLFLLPFAGRASNGDADENPGERLDDSNLSTIAIDLFLRAVEENASGDSEFNPGIGIFLVEKNAPHKVKVGTTLKYLDTKEEFQFGLVAGYTL